MAHVCMGPERETIEFVRRDAPGTNMHRENPDDEPTVEVTNKRRIPSSFQRAPGVIMIKKFQRLRHPF